MKKRVFRERQLKAIKETIHELVENVKVEEMLKETIKEASEKPKKRGRKKSVK